MRKGTYKHTAEAIERIRIAGTGRKLSAEAIEKRKIARSKIRFSDSTIEKFRQNMKKASLGITADVVARRSEKIRGKPQTKPIVAKGPQNKQSRTGILRDPNGRTWKFKNLTHFVRENEHLFTPEDVEWKHHKSKPRALWCRAQTGLLALVRGARGSWKGWTVASLTEAFHNAGEDLLERQSLTRSPSTSEPAS